MTKPGRRPKAHYEPCGTDEFGVPAWLLYTPNGDILPVIGTVRQLAERAA